MTDRAVRRGCEWCEGPCDHQPGQWHERALSEYDLQRADEIVREQQLRADLAAVRDALLLPARWLLSRPRPGR